MNHALSEMTHSSILVEDLIQYLGEVLKRLMPMGTEEAPLLRV